VGGKTIAGTADRAEMFRSAVGGEQQSSGPNASVLILRTDEEAATQVEDPATERVACGPRDGAADRVYAGYGGSPKLNVETT